MNAAQNGNGPVVRYARWVIRWRYLVILGCIVVALGAGSGARFLGFDTDYRVFFGKENPQLLAFDAMQDIYTKNDNVLFVIAPRDGEVFTPAHLEAIEKLTKEAWKVPFAIRVDAISNFQNTYSEDDDLIVEDLVYNGASYTPEQLQRARTIALQEPIIRNRLLSDRAHVTGVNVTLQLMGESMDEVPQAAAYVRELAQTVRDENPDLDVYLSGMVMLNNAFSEASKKDLSTLVPIMYVGMFLIMLLLLRSVSGALGTMIVVALSTMTAIGLTGWSGIKLTPPSSTAPTMIMTLAIADSIHILVTMLTEMRTHGRSKHDAIVESLRVNMQPVFLTSLTTMIGFLSMNFSDSPPFQHLGNITAAGVGFAWIYSVLFLPALMSILPVRVKRAQEGKSTFIDNLSNFAVGRRKPLLWGSVAIVAILAAFIPRIELNDKFVEYFDERIEFRSHSDFMMENLTGVYQVEYSLPADGSNGVTNPEYLDALDRFEAWFEQQPNVLHVSTFSTTMKRLNKNLHSDDDEWYRTPDNRELAAQYLLLYEMSLPFGLDLNNQVNQDKSATRFTVTLGNASSREIRAAATNGENWLRGNAPAYMQATGVGSSVMFSYISERNINSMLGGTILALIIISFSLIFALRSFKYGLLSLIPNLIPAVLAFGTWAIFVGQIGLALSVVVGMTLGIVVDDTVHFLSKYIRARREKGLDAEAAVRYAFSTVGVALIVTSIILIAGFLVLAQSAFNMNAGMGKLTAITIAFALLADFFLLPPLLIAVDKRRKPEKVTEREVDNVLAETKA